jgi:hypothetical protein
LRITVCCRTKWLAPRTSKNGEHIYYRRGGLAQSTAIWKSAARLALQSKGMAERRLYMRSRFLVRAALELRNKNSLEHTLGIGIAWSDLVRQGVRTGVKDLLSHRK